MAQRTRSNFFGTINQVCRCVLDLAGARPPRSTAKLLKAPLCPQRGFIFCALRSRDDVIDGPWMPGLCQIALVDSAVSLRGHFRFNSWLLLPKLARHVD